MPAGFRSLFARKTRRRSARMGLLGREGRELIEVDAGLYLVSVLPEPRMNRDVRVELRLLRDRVPVWTGRADLSDWDGWIAGEAELPQPGEYDLAWAFEDYPLLGGFIALVEPIVKCPSCGDIGRDGAIRCPSCKEPYPTRHPVTVK